MPRAASEDGVATSWKIHWWMMRCCISSVTYCQHGLSCNICEWDHKAPSCYQPFNKKIKLRVSEPVRCVNLKLSVSLCCLCCGSAGQPRPERPTRTLANPLQQAVYSKRIISPIPWCHCKATAALPHSEPLLQPLLTLPPSPQSEWCRPSRSGNLFSGSNHFPFRPGAFAQAQMLVSFFSCLSVRTTDKLLTGNKRPYAVSKGAI